MYNIQHGSCYQIVKLTVCVNQRSDVFAHNMLFGMFSNDAGKTSPGMLGSSGFAQKNQMHVVVKSK